MRKNYRMTPSCLVCRHSSHYRIETEKGAGEAWECHTEDAMRVSPAYVCDEFELSESAYLFLDRGKSTIRGD
jgi:hypothetical protein